MTSCARWRLPTTPSAGCTRRSLDLADELALTRWLLTEQTASSIQTPFLLVLVLWLGIIFASFGLFAPRNGTVYVGDRPFRALVVDRRLSHPRARSAVRRRHSNFRRAVARPRPGDSPIGSETREISPGAGTRPIRNDGAAVLRNRDAHPSRRRRPHDRQDAGCGLAAGRLCGRLGERRTGRRLALDTADDAYALVLLDLGLPKKGGLELLRELRRAGNKVRVLM